jgi:hypothetical protein
LTTSSTEKPTKSTNRLVKWINRKNVRRQYEKHKIRQKTNQYLFGNHKRNKQQSPPFQQQTQEPQCQQQTYVVTTVQTSLLDKDDDKITTTTTNNNNNNGRFLLREESDEYNNNDNNNNNTDEQWECIPHDGQIELCAVPSDFANEEGVYRDNRL